MAVHGFRLLPATTGAVAGQADRPGRALPPLLRAPARPPARGRRALILVRHPLSTRGSVTPQPPGRTPHSASWRASGTTQPQAPLRCPGGETLPTRGQPPDP